MSLAVDKRQGILEYLLKEIKKNNTSLVLAASQQFKISKQSIYRYISHLADNGQILVTKNGRYNSYKLVRKQKNFNYKTKGLQEDIVWANDILPVIKDSIPKNVLNACNYGFTEILNNTIDHSGATEVQVALTTDSVSIEFAILDAGVGIFNKIQKSLGLDNPKQSILELAKGKFTTDPANHSGEGIFFTSRIFDSFYISSDELQFLSGRNNGPDYLFENKKSFEGTCVMMEINKDSDVNTQEVFDEFTAIDDDYGFTKTHIPVRLAEHEGELLVSRSQAKRLAHRFEHFKEVVLDFKDVTEIGQAFADELFRVFNTAHPEVKLYPINMSKEVQKMVLRVLPNSFAN